MSIGLKNKNEYLRYDIAAAVTGAALFAFLFFCARLGVPTVDEADYCNLRFVQGDIPFVEWWDPAQLFWFTMEPVIRVYKAAFGSTDGLLLFMRYFFLFADLLFYVFTYIKLRRFRFAGLMAAVCFCAVVPQTLFAVSYFTVASFAFNAACLALIVDEKEKKPLPLILTGAFLAVGIMSEPFLIIIYIIYIAAVCLREMLKSKTAFLEGCAGFLNKRTCLWLTLGAFFVFAALMARLFFAGTFSRLSEMLPFIFGGVKYNANAGFDLTKLRTVLSYFGGFTAVGLAVLLAAAVVIYFTKTSKPAVRLSAFALSCAVAGYAWGGIFYRVFIAGNKDIVYFILYHQTLMPVLALIWTLLLKKRDVRMLSLCVAAVLYGAAVDTSSSSYFGAGGWTALFPAIYGFCGLTKEVFSLLKRVCLKDGAKNKAPVKALLIAALAVSCACAVSFVLWDASFVGLETVNSPIEKYTSRLFGGDPGDYGARIESGPFKGIVTSEKIAGIYNGALEDLDYIKENSNGAPVMIEGFTPFAYLYLDLPYGSHGAWYDGDSARAVEYWKKFPERKPRYIYFPLFDNLYWVTLEDMPVRVDIAQAVQKIKKEYSVLGDFEVSEGKAGVFLKALP